MATHNRTERPEQVSAPATRGIIKLIDMAIENGSLDASDRDEGGFNLERDESSGAGEAPSFRFGGSLHHPPHWLQVEPPWGPKIDTNLNNISRGVLENTFQKENKNDVKLTPI